MNDLANARNIINETDKELARLFEKRMQAVREVAAYKAKAGLPILDAEREAEVIRQNTEYITAPEIKPYFVGWMQKTMELSRAYQHKLCLGRKIAYAGTCGAYAELAAERYFPDAETVGYPSFESAYHAVKSGECDAALLPIENSIGGDVGQVMDLAFFGELYINGIYEYDIRHRLLGVPGSDKSTVKRVLSHPQALLQCAAEIEKNGWQSEEVSSTAVAAQTVADRGDKSLAAIGSDDAARNYGLKILDTGIEDKPGNTTRFALFSPVPKEKSERDDRFVMTFTVNNEAGALGQAVSVIGWHGFNLRALKSRPTKNLSWNYYFFAEGEGNLHSSEGRAMLTELKTVCHTVRLVGSFEVTK